MHARATIGFGFTSGWLKKWRENFEPITESTNHKPKQFANYFRHSIENHSKARNDLLYLEHCTGIAEVMGLIPVGTTWLFQVSIRGSCLNCPDKCVDHFSLSFIVQTSNIYISFQTVTNSLSQWVGDCSAFTGNEYLYNYNSFVSKFEFLKKSVLSAA